MSRIYPADYCGARERLSLAQAERTSAHVLQPKYDGQYVDVHTDREGRVFAVRSRTGRDVRSDLLGVATGIPWSQFAAELESHTDAGVRAAARRGYQCAHIFDVVRIDGRHLGPEPFRARWDALARARERVAERDPDKPWLDDASGRAHDKRSGRFSGRIPRGWRRLPLAPLRPASAASSAWADWYESDDWVEGLVSVALDAPIGARRAKRKIKQVDTVDAVVVSLDARRALVVWQGRSFTVGRCGRSVAIGDRVAVAHEGFYERGAVPRFPRLTDVRSDL